MLVAVAAADISQEHLAAQAALAAAAQVVLELPQQVHLAQLILVAVAVAVVAQQMLAAHQAATVGQELS
jgi:hypothetical protein